MYNGDERLIVLEGYAGDGDLLNRDILLGKSVWKKIKKGVKKVAKAAAKNPLQVALNPTGFAQQQAMSALKKYAGGSAPTAPAAAPGPVAPSGPGMRTVRAGGPTTGGGFSISPMMIGIAVAGVAAIYFMTRKK